MGLIRGTVIQQYFYQVVILIQKPGNVKENQVKSDLYHYHQR